jgi:hypothetical protein
MISGRGLFIIAAIFMAAVLISPSFLRNAEAWPRGDSEFEEQRGVQVARGIEAARGPRGGEAVEGPRGNVAAEGPRGNVAVGTRYPVLPDSAKSLIVGDRTYFLDEGGVYYLPCDDDNTVYCVVPAPQ